MKASIFGFLITLSSMTLLPASISLEGFLHLDKRKPNATTFQNARNVKPDARLYEALSDAEIAEMQSKNPFLISYYNYFLDHSYKIIDQPQNTKLDLPKVIIPNLNTFNILVLKKDQKLKREWATQTYYEIEGTKKVLVFISEREFTQKLNKHLGRDEGSTNK